MALAPPLDRDLPELCAGDLVAGRFRIVDIIGRGGFSVVYRAHQEGMNRFVALKVLKPKASADPTIVERFRREALFASQLSHPNTITLFDYGQTDNNLCYIAMEYLEGHDLSEEVRDRDPMDLKRVWFILTQICHSLAEAHRMGLVHRDLKPENIFLVRDDEREKVKVLDFGVSKALSDFGRPLDNSLSSLTVEGTVFGTPLYMAPEQAMADTITPAVDVYALGHMAFEMITGWAAYDNEKSAMDVMLRQINDPPLALPAPWHATPFADLVRRCTEKDPYRRIQNAGHLLEELMSEAFLPYMDLSEIPASLRPALHSPHLIAPQSSLTDIEAERRKAQLYHRELAILDSALDEVRESAQMRLVVLHGKRGAGRKDLTRAFVLRHQTEVGLRIIHRQARRVEQRGRPGLEADLAQAAGLSLRGEGIGELNRLLRKALAKNDLSTLVEMAPVSLDSDSLSKLSNQRELFFSRLIEPFRRAARVGTLIWAIESLEDVDPLTLAFLDYFIREMRIRPSSVLLITSLYPDALVQRPGLMRFAQAIITAPSTYARHLRLIEPGRRKEEERPRGEIRRSPAAPDLERQEERDLSTPEDLLADLSALDFDDDEFALWAAQADGEQPQAPQDQQILQKSSPTAAPEVEYRGVTERIELFTSLETSQAEPDDESAQIHGAFDTVLGYLAQLDERVVSRELWRFIYPRVLPFTMTRMMGLVLDYAARFGILALSEEAIAFSDPEYAQSLRKTFKERPDLIDAHAELASLLHEFSPRPGRDELRRIVHHAVEGHDFERAIRLLLRAGDEAYEQMDLDTAREHYLQFQTLIDELSIRSPVPSVAFNSYPQVWLRIGKIQGALGEYGFAEDALLRARREARSDDHKLLATANKLLGDLAMTQDRIEQARTYFESARDLYHQTSLARPFVACLGAIGHCAALLGDLQEAESILEQAVERAEKLQDTVLAAYHYTFMGKVMIGQARFLKALEYLHKALEIFEDQKSLEDIIACLGELGRANIAAGLYREAQENYSQALALATTRHLKIQYSPHLGLARALAAQNKLDQAQIHLVEAMSEYSVREQPIQRAEAQYHLGDLYLAMGRPSIAEEHFHHVYEIAQNVGQRQLATDALVRRAYALFDKESHDDCFATLIKTVAYAEDAGDKERAKIARAHIIYLQLRLHDFQTATDAFSTLIEDYPPHSQSACLVLSQLFRADLAIARRHFDLADQLLQETRKNAATLSDPGLFIPITRRETLLRRHRENPRTPHPIQGFALGSLLPPETRI